MNNQNQNEELAKFYDNTANPADSNAKSTSSSQSTDDKFYGDFITDSKKGAYATALRPSMNDLRDHLGIDEVEAERSFKSTAKAFAELEVSPADAPKLHSTLTKYMITPMTPEELKVKTVEARKAVREKYGNEASKVIAETNAYVTSAGLGDLMRRGAGSDKDFVLELIERVQRRNRSRQS